MCLLKDVLSLQGTSFLSSQGNQSRARIAERSSAGVTEKLLSNALVAPC